VVVHQGREPQIPLSRGLESHSPLNPLPRIFVSPSALSERDEEGLWWCTKALAAMAPLPWAPPDMHDGEAPPPAAFCGGALVR
jgi:hypothetical protein